MHGTVSSGWTRVKDAASALLRRPRRSPPSGATGPRDRGGWDERGAQRILGDVQVLLEYLNRLPETRLDRFMGDTARLQAAGGLPVPRAPAETPAAFLSRIVAIAKASEGEAWSITATSGATGAAGETPNDLAFLLAARDFLGAIAYPVTVDTIHVTRAYREARASMRNDSILARVNRANADQFLAQFGIAMAKRVRRYQRGVIALLFTAFWASFLVFWGNNLLAENRDLQATLREHAVAIDKAAREDEPRTRTLLLTTGQTNASLLVRGYCDYDFELLQLRSIPVALPQEVFQPSALGLNLTQEAASGRVEMPVFLVREARGEPTPRVWFSQRQHDLCLKSKELAARERELKMMHRPWVNAAAPALVLSQAPTSVLRGVNAVAEWMGLPRPLRLPPDPPVRASGPDESNDAFTRMNLETHRVALQQLVPGLVGNILPMAYAALGSLASMFRRISARAEAELLGPADYGAMRNSMILGLLTGAVIGLFSATLGGGASNADSLPLGPTAFALLAGFAADRVFAMLDSLADRIFGAMPNRIAPSQPPR